MNIAEWLDNIDPRAFYYHTVFDDIPEDFSVSIDIDKNVKVTVGFDGRSETGYMATWDDELASMIARGLPFFIFDEDYEGDEPEEHGIYSVVKYDEELVRQISMLGAGYMIKNKDTVNKWSIDGGSIYRMITKLVCGEVPGDKYMGRGFAASANLKAVKAAMGLQTA
jgi:predicted lipoprotein with Yx(FWY)xxD motif